MVMESIACNSVPPVGQPTGKCLSQADALFGDTMLLSFRLRPHMIEAGRCGASADKTGPSTKGAHHLPTRLLTRLLSN